MKHSKTLFFLLIIGLYGQTSFCQRPTTGNTGDVRRDTAAKKTFLEQLLKSLADNIQQDSTKKPVEKNARIAYEFKREKIYPSDDALEIVYLLNPWLEDVDDIPAGKQLKMPSFPRISGDQRRQLKADFNAGSVPDSRASAQFNSLAATYNENIDNFTERYRKYMRDNTGYNQIDPRSFLDTLRLFKTLLRNLNAGAVGIAKSKMQYLNTNLAYLTDNIKSTVITDRTVLIVMNIIKDFYATSDRGGHFSQLQQSPARSIYFTASYRPGNYNRDNNGNFFPPPVENKALKCRVYVYDEKGKVIKDRFEVYFAPYITTYNLSDCDDILMCIKDKSGTIKANLASTAAACIANNSNWAIYCTDNKNNITHLINEKYNYQNIVDRDENDNRNFKILLLFHDN